MVAHLVRLKLALLAGGLRRSVWRVVGFVLGALYVAGMVGLCLVGLTVLGRHDDPELARTILVLSGGALVAGWWLVPLVAFGVDSTLDPQALRLFPLTRGRLLAGMAVAGVVGLPGVATTVLAAGSALAWYRSPLAAIAALVGGTVGVALCVVGSRAVTTLVAPLVGGRRFRELAAVLVLVPVMLGGPLAAAAGAGLAAVSDALPAVADVVAWTPLGAPWALAADVAGGGWPVAGLRLLVALAALAALALAWDRALAAALVRPAGGGHASRSAGLGFLGRLPATPTGAVAARCLTYWLRDARYATAVAIVPVQVVLLWFLSGGGPVMLATGPLVAFIMGWSVSSDVSYDHTAFWTHVAAPVDGLVDRAGRAWAAMAVGGVVVLATDLLTLGVTGRWDATVPVLGMSLGVLATAVGAASVYSARVVFPVAKPGENPFSTPQGSSFAVALTQGLALLVLLVLVLPTVVAGVVAIVTGGALPGALSLVLGVGLGGALLVAGVRTGARLYDRRAPELLATLRTFA